MNINNRLQQIDNFFENLTIEEFDKKLEKAGINEIKPSSDSNVVGNKWKLSEVIK